MLYYFVSEKQTRDRFFKLIEKYGGQGKNGEYILPCNTSLNTTFGHNWSVLFHNMNGDFSYIINGTLQFCARDRTTHEIVYNGEFEKISKTVHQLKITFVRGDSNFKGFKEKVHLKYM